MSYRDKFWTLSEAERLAWLTNEEMEDYYSFEYLIEAPESEEADESDQDGEVSSSHQRQHTEVLAREESEIAIDVIVRGSSEKAIQVRGALLRTGYRFLGSDIDAMRLSDIAARLLTFAPSITDLYEDRGDHKVGRLDTVTPVERLNRAVAELEAAFADCTEVAKQPTVPGQINLAKTV
jgi:hypothetical protein